MFYITYEELTRFVVVCCSHYVHHKFYITYEELTLFSLKRSINYTTVLHYLWGIDTKNPFSTHVFIRENGFYITYEELTLLRFLFFFLFLICFTLPMRNWHEPLTVHDHLCSNRWFLGKNVLHYLWGIDTSSINLCINPVNLPSRFTLPMRNWHIFCICQFC